MAGDKTVTVRMSPDLFQDLLGLSILDGTNLAQQIRRGLGDYVASRKGAPNFQDEVKAATERQVESLSALTRK